MQIYQEKIFDLLIDDSKLQLNIREDPGTGDRLFLPMSQFLLSCFCLIIEFDLICLSEI